MNSLDLALNEYIAIRRALGFELREVAGCLRNFVAFLKIEGASYITRELALRWATQPAGVGTRSKGCSNGAIHAVILSAEIASSSSRAD